MGEAVAQDGGDFEQLARAMAARFQRLNTSKGTLARMVESEMAFSRCLLHEIERCQATGQAVSSVVEGILSSVGSCVVNVITATCEEKNYQSAKYQILRDLQIIINLRLAAIESGPDDVVRLDLSKQGHC